MNESISVHFFNFFLFYLGVHSSVSTCSPMTYEAQGRNVPNSLTVGMGFHCLCSERHISNGR